MYTPLDMQYILLVASAHNWPYLTPICLHKNIKNTLKLQTFYESV